MVVRDVARAWLEQGIGPQAAEGSPRRVSLVANGHEPRAGQGLHRVGLLKLVGLGDLIDRHDSSRLSL